jgi:signal transduction histidine kinase
MDKVQGSRVREPQLVLLALDEAAYVNVALAANVAPRDPPIIVELAQGAASSAVARARERYPRAALAVVGPTDADAIEAIAAGADDALTSTNTTPREVALLAERALTRAHTRMLHITEQNRAAHAEKLAALGTVVAGVAHEINNPLQSITLNLELATRDLEPLIGMFTTLENTARAARPLSPSEVAAIVERARTGATINEMRAMLADMLSSLNSIADIVRDLRVYARSDDTEVIDIIDVDKLLDRVIRTVDPQIRARGHVERDYENGLPKLLLPRSRIVQVLTNILVNAAQAMGEIERPVHRIRVTARSDGDFVAVSIADSGPGIAPEVLDRIFDPFFTTKGAGKGTGLGLAISQSIMRELGGDLLAESVHGEGATFIVLLPAADPDAVAAVRAQKESKDNLRPITKRPTVLIVEDDDRLLRVYPQSLHGHYDVIVAAHGQEAIDLLSSGSHADVVMTDLAMPGMDGQSLHAWLAENRPELATKTIFVTAGAQDADAAKFLKETRNIVLEKPVTRKALLDALRKALATS